MAAAGADAAAAAFSAAAFCFSSGFIAPAMALPAIDPTTAPTAMEPIVPIMPEPAAAGTAAGAAAAAGMAAGAGATAAGAAAAGALAGAGAAARGADFMPPPMRLAWASEGSVREATARVTMERLVRKEAFMKSLR